MLKIIDETWKLLSKQVLAVVEFANMKLTNVVKTNNHNCCRRLLKKTDNFYVNIVTVYSFFSYNKYNKYLNGKSFSIN